MTESMIERHISWCKRRELRPSYIRALQSTLTRIERNLGPLHTLTEVELEAWWDSLTIGAGARIAYLSHLSSFYRWLIYDRLRDDDPTVRLIRPRVHRGLPRPIGDASLDRALGAAGQPVRSWLFLAAYMGFRACEIAPLCREDVRADLGMVIIRDGKGGKSRTVPLHPEVARCLEYGPTSGPLFPARGGRVPMRANSVTQRANRYLHDLGIPETLHQLRHWFGTNVYRNSSDLRLTQELMGHSSPITTAGYAAWSPEKAAEVVASLDVREGSAA